MRATAWLSAMLVALAGVGCDASDALSGPPLFAAFKTLCIDTGAAPDAADEALRKAGATLKVNASDDTLRPDVVKMNIWNARFVGHDMMIATGREDHRAIGKSPPVHIESCSITSYANEDAGVGEIRKWVGIEPDVYSQLDGATYTYEMVDGQKHRLPDGDWGLKAQASGRLWTLTLHRFPDGAMVSLARHQTTNFTGRN